VQFKQIVTMHHDLNAQEQINLQQPLKLFIAYARLSNTSWKVVQQPGPAPAAVKHQSPK